MSEDTYKGESLAKKIARLGYWMKIREMLGPLFVSQTHLVLASREAGDISVLRGLGVPLKNIVGVDRVSSAVDEAMGRWPGARVFEGDIANIAMQVASKERIASVFLDFCAPIGNAVIDTTYRVIQRALRDGAIVGVGMLRGREKGRFRDVANVEMKAEYNRLRDTHPDTRGRVASLGSEMWDRDSMLNLELGKRSGLWKMGWAPVQVGEIHYQSATRESRGVPMMIAVMRVHREKPNAPREGFIRRMRSVAEAIDGSQDFIFRVGGSDTSTTQDFDDAMRETAAAVDCGIFPSICVGGRRLDDGVPVGVAHLLLNIDRATISAWKAHRTMGTYEKKGAA